MYYFVPYCLVKKGAWAKEIWQKNQNGHEGLSKNNVYCDFVASLVCAEFAKCSPLPLLVDRILGNLLFASTLLQTPVISLPIFDTTTPFPWKTWLTTTTAPWASNFLPHFCLKASIGEAASSTALWNPTHSGLGKFLANLPIIKEELEGRCWQRPFLLSS